MSTKVLNANESLQNCNGANQMFRNPMYNFNYTDGVRDFIKENSMYWFLDIIASHQNTTFWAKDGDSHTKKVLNHDFQVWELKRNLTTDKNGVVIDRKDSFVVTCFDGNKMVLKTQLIEFSDFEFDLFTVWLQNKILLLPSEY